MDKHEVLREAANYLAENGHCKGKLYTYEGKALGEPAAACALGAIRQASGHTGLYYDDDFNAACEHLGKHIRGFLPKDFGCIADASALIPLWNDWPDTTAEDVILALKTAAEEE